MFKFLLFLLLMHAAVMRRPRGEDKEEEDPSVLRSHGEDKEEDSSVLRSRGEDKEEEEESFVVFLLYNQWSCFSRIMESYKQSLDHYYHCILDNTLQCIQDVANYKYNPIILNYFCGAIMANEIKHLETIWTIHSAANVNIFMGDFSMRHSNWNCEDEYVLITSKVKQVTNNFTDTYTFCGKRFPWQMTLPGFIVRVIFQKSERNSNGYFSLYYHTTNAKASKEIVVDIVYLKNPDAHDNSLSSLIDPTRINRLHFLCSHKNTIIQIWWFSASADVFCYDGPGQKSPLIKEDLRAESTTYQLYCVISTTNSTFYLNYLHKHNDDAKPIPITVEARGHTMYFSLSLDMNSHTSNALYEIQSDQLIANTKSHWRAILRLRIFKMKGIASEIVLNKRSCLYGGLFIYDRQYYSSFHGQMGYEEYEFTNQCDEDNIIGFPIYLASFTKLLLVVYKGYTEGDVEFEGEIVHKSRHASVFSKERNYVRIGMDTEKVYFATETVVVTSYLFLKNRISEIVFHGENRPTVTA